MTGADEQPDPPRAAEATMEPSAAGAARRAAIPALADTIDAAASPIHLAIDPKGLSPA